jgi:hypothetical protein
MKQPHKAKTMHMPKKVRTCRICGCDDLHACEGGCYWISDSDDLCSRCALDADMVADISAEKKAINEVTDILGVED